MLRKTASSDIEWRVYGELDYGASHDLRAGAEEWSLLRRHLRQMDFRLGAVCMEFGCGAGRLTAALARDFAVVHAVDISPERVEQARKAVGSDNVMFHLMRDAAVPLPNGVCDLCISTHVLQHLSDGRILRKSLAEMHRVLRPGGYLLVHVPVIGAHGMTGNLSETLRRRSKEMIKAVALFLTRRLMRMGIVRLPWKMDEYSVLSFVELSAFLRRIGFDEIELRILPWSGGHGYIFAKSSADVKMSGIP